MDEIRALADFVTTPSVTSVLTHCLPNCEISELAKLENSERLSTDWLIDFLDRLLKELDIDADSIAFYGTQIETFATVSKNKKIRESVKALIPLLSNLHSLTQIENAIRAFDHFSEQLRQGTKRAQTPQHVERYCLNLEQTLHEALVVCRLRSQIKHVLRNIRKPEKNEDAPLGAIFQKRHRVDPPKVFDVQPKILDWSTASPDERDMMRIRKEKLSQIWEKTNEDMRPYETLRKLQKENKELKELDSLCEMSPGDVERLEQENAEKVRLIERFREAVVNARKALETETSGET